MTQGAMWVDLSCAQEDRTTEGERAGLARSRRRPLGGRRGVWLAGAIGACAVGWLTGCGSSPPAPQQTFADYTPTVTPTASPSPPTVEVPTRPAEMERSDEVGATAAATHFMELFEYVLQTGDHEQWDQIGVPDCGFCAKARDRAVRIYGAGGRIVGGEMELGTAELLVYDEQLGVYAVSVPYAFASASETDSAGETITSVEADQGALVLEVIYSAGGWTLLGGSQDEEADK